MLGDTPVKASSQVVTHRETLTTLQAVGPQTAVGTPWYVLSCPRQFLWANQTDAGLAAKAHRDARRLLTFSNGGVKVGMYAVEIN